MLACYRIISSLSIKLFFKLYKKGLLIKNNLNIKMLHLIERSYKVLMLLRFELLGLGDLFNTILTYLTSYNFNQEVNAYCSKWNWLKKLIGHFWIHPLVMFSSRSNIFIVFNFRRRNSQTWSLKFQMRLFL